MNREAEPRIGGRRHEIVLLGMSVMSFAAADIIAHDTDDPGPRLFVAYIIFLYGCITVMRAMLLPEF
jgi:hypothetical protein